MKPRLVLNNKNIYLVRHGLSTLSKWGYGKRKLTADLLPQGEIAVRKIARYLKGVPASYNASSDLARCRQTTEIISRITGKSFYYDKRLTDFHHETFTDFKKRISGFLEDISSVNKKNVIICTHAAVIAAMKHFITENKFIYKDRFDYPKEGELVIIKSKEYKKINFN